ncbi:MAG: hypothetical protein CMF62_02315 [Magnetococcales bacterium]|nr:hypothetical protein [Magnetococcales bacterium]|tara:strand:+ start:5267 stop:6556 length:1290 start_codon:yes stop_codon:yes gene_type:complete
MHHVNLGEETKIETKKEKTISGLVGFRNIGNTCYMNSILQCLLSIPELAHFFLTKDFVKGLELNAYQYLIEREMKHFKYEREDQVKVTNSKIKMICENSITHQLYRIFEQVYSKNVSIIPTGFKNIIGKYNPEFKGFNQNDSHELINLVLDRLHEDTGRKVIVRHRSISEKMKELVSLHKEVTNIFSDETISMKDKKLAQERYRKFKRENEKEVWMYRSYLYWKDYIQKKRSFISEMFFGMFCSVITTNGKQVKYPSFYPFTTLSVPIPNVPHGTTVTLKDCLKSFSEEEVLEGDESYYCQEEKKKVSASKRMYIWQPPKILIIHLARFKNMGMSIRKINTPVEYPLTGLTLDECYSEHKKHNYSYDLISVSLHMGSSNGGHYTAYRKNMNGVWYDCNDSSVSYISKEDVKNIIVNKNAYILVYRRQKI